MSDEKKMTLEGVSIFSSPTNVVEQRLLHKIRSIYSHAAELKADRDILFATDFDWDGDLVIKSISGALKELN